PRRRPVAQRAVGPNRVVLLPPGLRYHPRLQHAGELFPLQQLIPQPAVERLRVPVLPRRLGLDVQPAHPAARQPLPDGSRDELRAVVAADVPRLLPRVTSPGHIMMSPGTRAELFEGRKRTTGSAARRGAAIWARGVEYLGPGRSPRATAHSGPGSGAPRR